MDPRLGRTSKGTWMPRPCASVSSLVSEKRSPHRSQGRHGRGNEPDCWPPTGVTTQRVDNSSPRASQHAHSRRSTSAELNLDVNGWEGGLSSEIPRPVLAPWRPALVTAAWRLRPLKTRMGYHTPGWRRGLRLEEKQGTGRAESQVWIGWGKVAATSGTARPDLGRGELEGPGRHWGRAYLDPGAGAR